ncbi:uncharacterized [Tachysurus ichikawai]
MRNSKSKPLCAAHGLLLLLLLLLGLLCAAQAAKVCKYIQFVMFCFNGQVIYLSVLFSGTPTCAANTLRSSCSLFVHAQTTLSQKTTSFVICPSFSVSVFLFAILVLCRDSCPVRVRDVEQL